MMSVQVKQCTAMKKNTSLTESAQVTSFKNPIPYGVRLPPILYGGAIMPPPYLKCWKIVGWRKNAVDLLGVV